jgi:hypothetical protein
MRESRHRVATRAAAGLFEDVELTGEVRRVEETADELLAQLGKTSLYFRIDPNRRPSFERDERELVARLGGTIRQSFATVLMTARRV